MEVPGDVRARGPHGREHQPQRADLRRARARALGDLRDRGDPRDRVEAGVAHVVEARVRSRSSSRCGGSRGSLVEQRVRRSTCSSITETLRTVALRHRRPTEVLRGLGYWFFYGHEQARCRGRESSVAYLQDHLAHRGELLDPGGRDVRRRRGSAGGTARSSSLLVVVGVIDRGRRAPLRRSLGVSARSSSRSRQSRASGSRCATRAAAVPLSRSGSRCCSGSAVNARRAAWSARGVGVRGLVLAALLIVLAIANMPSLRRRHAVRQEPAARREHPAVLDRRDRRARRRSRTTPASWRSPGRTSRPTDGGPRSTPSRRSSPTGPTSHASSIAYGSAGSAEPALRVRRPPAGPGARAGRDRPGGAAPERRRSRVPRRSPDRPLQPDRAPLPTWLFLTQPTIPQGLGGTDRPTGRASARRSQIPKIDEVALALPPGTPDPAPVSIFPVKDTPKIVHAASANGSLLVSGDGAGLVDLGTVGALDDNNRLVLYCGVVRRSIAAALRKAAAQPGRGARRHRLATASAAQRWGIIECQRSGHRTSRRDAVPQVDASDQRLDVFPGRGPHSQTVVRSPGAQVIGVALRR